MTEGLRVLITPDPGHPNYRLANGRGLLAVLAHIGSVERTPAGVAYHEDFADEVRAALSSAGYRITDADARTQPATRGPARHIPGHTHPDGEADTCRRCNPEDWYTASVTHTQAHPTPDGAPTWRQHALKDPTLARLFPHEPLPELFTPPD